MYKLSIITINYNNLEGLKRTIESVVNQTWQEFEHIVIDGGSTDGSAEYIETQSNKINYWVSELDKGIYNAMNKGIKAATGDYLLFLNSGDHFFNDEVLMLNHQYLTEYDLVYFNLQMINSKFMKTVIYPDKLRFSDLYLDSLPHPATFINKQLFNTVGLYDENLKIVSDWKFFILALFKFNCNYLKVDATLSTFYLDGISSNENFSEERQSVLKQYFSGFVLDNEELILNRKYINTNRFKLLQEIEKTKLGKKVISVFFRSYVFLFSKKKLKDILN